MPKRAYMIQCFQSKVKLETNVGIDTKIALSEIAFKIHPNNLTENIDGNFLKISLTINNRKVTDTNILLPEIKLHLPGGRYDSVYRLKQVLYNDILKKIRYFGSDQRYYRHFFTRIDEKNGCFCIRENDSSKKYTVDLEFGSNIKKFLNLPVHRVKITNDGYLCKEKINYQFNNDISFNCREIDETPDSGDRLKYSFVKSNNLLNLYFVEFQNLEYKTLKKQRFSELNFYALGNVEIVYFTVYILSSD